MTRLEQPMTAMCVRSRRKKIEPQSQLFEETVMILSGHGKTTVKNFAGQQVEFEWVRGSVRHPIEHAAPTL